MTPQRMMSVPNLLPNLLPKVEEKWRQALQLFTLDDGRTHGDVFTPTQIKIVDVIAKRRFSRTQLILPTQYGKSYAVADGVLLRASTHKEKWAIVSSTEDKARIIMDYIIDGIFADPMLSSKLEYNGSKEALKKERSKTRITFRGMGEIRVYSGNAGNTKAVKTALMGFGAPNLILDESGAIGDELYSTAKRMVGGAINKEAGEEGFILEIGNPVYRNHFHRTWFGERYMKIYVNDQMALAEGRFSEEFLAEMRDEAGYDWMYGCLFPNATEVLANGYRRLISDLVIDDAMLPTRPDFNYKKDEDGAIKQNKWGFDIIDDDPLLGIDPAGGGTNKTKFVLRFPKHGFAMVARTSESDDLEVLADIAEELIREWSVPDYRTAIDAGGLGHGLPAILKQRGYLVKAVLFGEKSLVNFKVPTTFLNMRAWMYWEARTWLMRDEGKLVHDPGFQELKLINYRQNSTLRTQIEPKEEMIKRLSGDGTKVESPDTADAFVLTFVDVSGIVDEEDIYVG